MYAIRFGRWRPLAVLAAGLTLFCACGAGGGASADAAYQQITQEEAKELLDQDADHILLDVRTQEEYDGGHIAGAICLPNETIDAETAAAALPDKDQLILVYCRSGNRSKQAAQKLADLGYTDVREFGGVNTWPYGLV